MTRAGDAADITTTTTNFGHFGSVNPNYSNPFDKIYPWSKRKLCNIDLDLYRGLQSGDSLKDCVKAWEDDAGFSYSDPCGVWVYTPPFYGKSWDEGGKRYFDVSQSNSDGAIFYPEQITGRWFGTDTVLTIGGESKHCLFPTVGQPLANVSLANQHTYAKNWGASLVDIYKLDASTLLFLVEYANYNIQNAIGRGADSVYVQGLHPDADVTDGTQFTITGLTSSQLGNFVVGATVDFGTSDGGNQTARRALVAVETADGVTTVTVDSPITITTDTYVSIHGTINVADGEIGSHSGYIGTNSRCNAYYRGEVLYANRWQYILGAYRQTETGSIFICDKDTTDDYDALNTAVHHDTGLVLPSASGYVKAFGRADGLSAPPFCTETGGGAGNANPVGDYCYVPALAAGNTILIFGGNAADGLHCGFYGNWSLNAGNSYWSICARPSLKTP